MENNDLETDEMKFFGVRMSTIGFGICLGFTCLLAMASAGKPSTERTTVTSAPSSTDTPSNALQISMPPLPYSHGALAPYISKETVDFHYGKHQAGYVAKLNTWLSANPASIELVRTVQHATPASVTTALARALPKGTPPYNLAAQIFNHALYFATLGRDSPLSRLDSTDPFKRAIDMKFGDTHKLREAFRNLAVNHFGSGWAWLLLNKTDSGSHLAVVATHDAETALDDQLHIVPLAVCDVWEHAYYIDYRNDRARYIDSWFEVTDWAAVSRRFAAQSVETTDPALVSRTYPTFG